MAATMSARQYAKHRGVSHTAVQKALRDGRIRSTNGKIDPSIADAAWKANTDPSKQTTVAPEPASDAARGSYTTSRAVRESYLARLAKLEYEERIGKLISADESRIAQFTAARKARDMLLGLSAQLAPLLVGLSEVSEVERILTAELTRVCSAISAEVRK